MRNAFSPYPRVRAPAIPPPMLDQTNQPPLPPEIARRRTFAIISHPDAGKTTLTEKLLLHGPAARFRRVKNVGRG